MAHVQKKELKRVLREAEDQMRAACDSKEVGAGCRPQCMAGGVVAIGIMQRFLATPTDQMHGLPKKMGIIVSPFQDCPKGFEEIIVRGGRNSRVKVCRLDEDHRKKFAPKGRPAYKGALRRKTKPRYLPGITTRDIQEG